MTALRQLRVVALLEGLSFLLLLGVAMPLKHVWGMTGAVRVAGSVHGLLFLLFVSALVRVSAERAWPLGRSLGAVAASLFPGGTFLLDRSLRREERADAVAKVQDRPLSPS